MRTKAHRTQFPKQRRARGGRPFRGMWRSEQGRIGEKDRGRMREPDRGQRGAGLKERKRSGEPESHEEKEDGRCQSLPSLDC